MFSSENCSFLFCLLLFLSILFFFCLMKYVVIRFYSYDVNVPDASQPHNLSLSFDQF